MNSELVLVLDFGGQYNQLIARRVRECNVYAEVIPYTTSLEDIKAKNPKGIIFTGGPNSVYKEDSPSYDKSIFEIGVPILGICYGSQLMAYKLGGEVATPMGWAKDKILTGEIGKILDSTDGSDYIYTISVQGHGDYPSDYPEGFVPEITVTGFFDTAKEKAFTYYVNQIHEMDNFLRELTAMLESRDEETVLVMYGDHLPGFSFTDEVLENGDIYQTQYVVWSNFSLPSEKENLESYQLAAHVQQMLGMSEGYLTKFHQKREDTPDYLKDLKILEYDILYGNCDLYGGENPFQATNLIMGQNDITITSAYNYKDYVCVEGSNFNDYSVVYINDKAYPTEIINSHLLRVEKAQVTAGNIVSVVQQGDDKIELSRVYLQVGESENK